MFYLGFSFNQGENKCSTGNGGCEQLCFPLSLTDRKCACQSHYTLNPNDNKSCIGKPLSVNYFVWTEIYGGVSGQKVIGNSL